MGLLTSYSSANLVVDTQLTVAYAKRRIFGEWVYANSAITNATSVDAVCFTRTATASFRYIGMDEATARACAADMLRDYTRSTVASRFESGWDEHGTLTDRWVDQTANTVLMADVACVHTAGSMWEVVVNVREYDEKMREWRHNGSWSCEAMFTSENTQRGYPGLTMITPSQQQTPGGGS